MKQSFQIPIMYGAGNMLVKRFDGPAINEDYDGLLLAFFLI